MTAFQRAQSWYNAVPAVWFFSFSILQMRQHMPLFHWLTWRPLQTLPAMLLAFRPPKWNSKRPQRASPTHALQSFWASILSGISRFWYVKLSAPPQLLGGVSGARSHSWESYCGVMEQRCLRIIGRSRSVLQLPKYFWLSFGYVEHCVQDQC